MKFKAMILLAGGAAAGYVFGTRAGRAQYEQIKARANTFAHDPAVQHNVANVAGHVKEAAERVPHPAAKVVSAAAGKIQSSMGDESDNLGDGTDTAGDDNAEPGPPGGTGS